MNTTDGNDLGKDDKLQSTQSVERIPPPRIVDFTARCMYSAKRGIAIVCRPSVRLSVRPSVRNVDVR